MDMVRKQVIGFYFGLCICLPAMSQEWTFGQVEKLPATINTNAEESMPLLSFDGRTLYFTRMMCEQNEGGKYAGQDMWVSKLEGTKWTKADKNDLSFFNNKKNNSVVGMSQDGKTLYLLDASSNKKMKGIYFSKNINGHWSRPELIPLNGINSDGFVGFYVSPDLEVILVSMKGEDSKGEEDLYVCLRNAAGQWSKPKNLGPSINTTGFEISPFLSADKKRLFFSSNGHQGFGDGDIFYAERLYDSWETWSTPKNLGETLNSKFFDGYFSLYGDTVTYFISNRNYNLANIYKAKSSFHALTGNERLLTKAEMRELFGIEFSSILSFTEENADLLPSHKELLWYIGNKLIGKYGVKIMLEVSTKEDSAIIQKRISEIIAQLALSGLEGSRILQTDYSKKNNTLEKNEVNLVFVR